MREAVKLTIKNISDRKIFACEVKIFLNDENIPVIYRYNALKVERDKTFGWKREIALPDNTARSFDVAVSAVIFEYYSEWKNDIRFVPISSLESLAAGFGSEDIAKQFTVQYGNDCQYKPTNTADLWYCTCGAVNHISEPTCYKCRRKREGFPMSMQKLSEGKVRQGRNQNNFSRSMRGRELKGITKSAIRF